MIAHSIVTRDDIASALFAVALDLAAGLGFAGLSLDDGDNGEEDTRIPTDAEVTYTAAQPVMLAAALADVARALDVELPPAIAAALDITVEIAPNA